MTGPIRFTAGLSAAARLARNIIVLGTCVLVTASAAHGGARGPAALGETTVKAREWALYKDRFIAPDGRVVDVEKAGVTHSEGQGYGLLLAVRAGDRDAFDRILAFAERAMRVRADGLYSWIWDPRAFPRVSDTNNATDGDILIAFALVEAALRWDEPRYLARATALVDAIGRHLVRWRNGHVILAPAVYGFGAEHQPDGPIVNLSYYVYGALLLFHEIDNRHPWLDAWRSGLALTREASLVTGHLPPDWASLDPRRRLQPALRHARRSSYDAVRIPLYMALGGRVPRDFFVPFDEAWNAGGRMMPQDVDLSRGVVVGDMSAAGYRAIAALTACIVRAEPIPAALRRYANTTYFSSSLHLLALSAARAHHSHCLDGGHAPVTYARAGPAGPPSDRARSGRDRRVSLAPEVPMP